MKTPRASHKHPLILYIKLVPFF
ncbi:unknown protein [Simkania negevensis Z]|uniref:Uncharacterized protein n=1 Tax=Simkania negevensis (strain ATCC VR-1471 / DSM 27360 / Z) TaxID=331113 RepID=F8L9N4_SIMNZ|nr:unknown protein [Simkania negevensis Z]